MIIHDVIQGTDAWLNLRMGKITASNASRIITPKTMKPSASQEEYMDEMLADLFYGIPLDSFKSTAMQEGTEFEPVAANIYCVKNDCLLEKIGFVTNDEGTIGCSPDRFILGQKKAVEIKVPIPKTQVRYLRGKSVDSDYSAQLQFQLWICELDKVDIFSYGRGKMPNVQIEVGRNQKFIDEAIKITGEFLVRFQEEKKKYHL